MDDMRIADMNSTSSCNPSSKEGGMINQKFGDSSALVEYPHGVIFLNHSCIWTTSKDWHPKSPFLAFRREIRRVIMASGALQQDAMVTNPYRQAKTENPLLRSAQIVHLSFIRVSG
jgi:hypothetical protein